MNKVNPEPTFGMGQFLFAIVLTILLLLLLQSMVRHRFFRGGNIKQPGSISRSYCPNGYCPDVDRAKLL
jgi:hypothetical protein